MEILRPNKRIKQKMSHAASVPTVFIDQENDHDQIH